LGINSEFIIKFSGLKPGVHQYSYNIDDRFFDLFEYSEIKSGNVKVDVVFDKTTDVFILDFSFNGTVKTECDRCLEIFDMPVEGTETLYVRFGDEEAECSENEIIISENDTQIDIKQFIYEFVILLLPIRRVHPDDEKGNSLCNKDVLDKLKLLQNNRTIDSPWEKLNDVKFKN
jgi:uncharacterized metal-binding protein YceD (DUF177 family)